MQRFCHCLCKLDSLDGLFCPVGTEAMGKVAGILGKEASSADATVAVAFVATEPARLVPKSISTMELKVVQLLPAFMAAKPVVRLDATGTATV